MTSRRRELPPGGLDSKIVAVMNDLQEKGITAGRP